MIVPAIVTFAAVKLATLTSPVKVPVVPVIGPKVTAREETLPLERTMSNVEVSE